jgi:hypothetical protein
MWCVFMLGTISYALHRTNTGVKECLRWTAKGIQFEQIAGFLKLECGKSNLQYFFIDSKLAHRQKIETTLL